MTQYHCRICGGKTHHILSYDNVPRAAQHLPKHDELSQETGICLDLYECLSCGVIQLSNEPVPYWKDVIRAVGISEEMRCFRANQFSSFVSRYNLQGKKGIELGCGDGAFLKELTATALTCWGMEHAPDNVARCQAQGLQTIQGYLEQETLLPQAPFDAFFVFSWLEHIPYIPQFLTALHSQLAENAVGIIEVPNFDMIIQQNLFSEFIVDHLYYFTQESLCRTLSMQGFDVLSCQPIWHNYILSAEVKKRPRLNVTPLKQSYDATVASVRSLYERYQKIALWGAGHQALTLIAMVGDWDRLAYIVDSAPFKQGCYSPVSHRPIVAPDTLHSDPVDALIIAAGSYSDEVCALAREKYKLNNIFIFRNNTIEKAGG